MVNRAIANSIFPLQSIAIKSESLRFWADCQLVASPPGVTDRGKGDRTDRHV